nr:unnamed protein product [Digitaria exilis]
MAFPQGARPPHPGPPKKKKKKATPTAPPAATKQAPAPVQGTPVAPSVPNSGGGADMSDEHYMILLSVEELFGRSLFQLLLLKLGLFQPLLTSTSLLLPLRRRSATFTDFPLLTTPWELADDA